MASGISQVTPPMTEKLRNYLCFSHNIGGESLNLQPGFSVHDILQPRKMNSDNSANIPEVLSTPEQKITISDASSTSSEVSEHLRRRGRPRSEDIELLQSAGKRAKTGIQCKYCFREFPRDKSLQAHLRVHTGERPFVCDYPGCNKRFTQSGQLNTHQRLHTGEKPFACSVTDCSSRFTHANRQCALHPRAVLCRVPSDQCLPCPKMLADASPGVCEWLQRFYRHRMERTPAKGRRAANADRPASMTGDAECAIGFSNQQVTPTSRRRASFLPEIAETVKHQLTLVVTSVASPVSSAPMNTVSNCETPRRLFCAERESSSLHRLSNGIEKSQVSGSQECASVESIVQTNSPLVCLRRSPRKHRATFSASSTSAVSKSRSSLQLPLSTRSIAGELTSPRRRPLPFSDCSSEPISLVVRRSPRKHAGTSPSTFSVAAALDVANHQTPVNNPSCGDWDSDENTPVRQSPRLEEARRRYKALTSGSPIRNPKKRWFVQCLKDQMSGRLSLSPAKSSTNAAYHQPRHQPSITQRRLNLDVVDDLVVRPSVIRSGVTHMMGAAMALVELSTNRQWAESPTN